MIEKGTVANNTNTKERNSNLEVLRIVSMFFIVLSHFSVHSSFSFINDSIQMNSYFTQITVLGNVGVNVFVLISSYFLCGKNEDIEKKCHKLFALWRPMFLYSAILYIVSVILGLTQFSIMGLTKSFFPVIFEQWWFATTYILMFIFSPFINRFIDTLNTKRHIYLVLIIGLMWTVIPTFTGQSLKCNDLLWFFSLYVLASFIRKNTYLLKRRSVFYLICAIAFFLIY